MKTPDSGHQFSEGGEYPELCAFCDAKDIEIKSLRDQLRQREKDIYDADRNLILRGEEIKNLKEALKELIPIAESVRISVDNPKWKEQFLEYKSKIDCAKSSLSPNEQTNHSTDDNSSS